MEDHMNNENKGKKSKRWIIALGLVLLLALAYYVIARQAPEKKGNEGKVKVTTTIFPLFDMARSIGGDKVETSLLLPPGMEAHSFEPSPSDIMAISQTDVFAYTGPAMEPWAEDILASQSDSSFIVVNASEGLELIGEEEVGHDEEEEEEGHDHNGVDPHIWLDFDKAKHIATAIGQALAQADPENSAYFAINTQAYIDGLDSLDRQYREGLADCQSRTIVYGGHYAFGYLAARYNLEYAAAQGLSPDSEPTPSDLIELVNQIRREDISTVFYEELSSPKIAETISEETGAKLVLLSAAHNLSKEDLEAGVSFFDVMEVNLDNLRLGLDCQ